MKPYHRLPPVPNGQILWILLVLFLFLTFPRRAEVSRQGGS
ncbi:MAG TPA: hypothetical protein VNZ64_26910 [Candidatus Acidoferrum sp.]|nr:hypothetical protein [Candidatus Acidoferrum sp.]